MPQIRCTLASTERESAKRVRTWLGTTLPAGTDNHEE